MTQTGTTLLKPPQVAKELGISIKTLMEHVKAGEIVYVPLGRGTKRPRLAFVPEDVREFIESRRRRDTCLSTNRKTARITHSTSKSPPSDFMALRAKLLAERQKRKSGV